MKRPRRIRPLPLNRIIPNLLTMLALSFGLSAIRFALQAKWEHAVLAILVAAILDALDGRIARLLKGTTKFGAELDSLSDFLCFGVAPATVLYVWSLEGAGRFGWSIVLVFCICCALRLARFNTDLEAPSEPAWSRNFFVGVPSPAGAGLALAPMVLWFQTDAEVLRSPIVVSIVMVLVAGALVSRIRTYSFKRVHIVQRHLLPTMLAGGVALAFLVSAPWITLSVATGIYLATIPFSARSYARLRRREPAAS